MICDICGEEQTEGQLLECPSCGLEGSTECCIPAGRGTECLLCEETASDLEDEDDDEDDDPLDWIDGEGEDE